MSDALWLALLTNLKEIILSLVPTVTVIVTYLLQRRRHRKVIAKLDATVNACADTVTALEDQVNRLQRRRRTDDDPPAHDDLGRH